ncbi:MAG: hypothetical protein NVS9B5_33500 [Terriglobales bacterium]
MAIQWRPMRPRDVRECVEIVATHPIQAPRYGPAIRNLKTFWQGLLGREAFRAIVFEEMQNDSRLRSVGLGVSVFISDDFLNHIKTPPYFWVSPELMKWEANGKSPILSDKQIRECNAKGGLNLLVLEGTFRSDHELPPEAQTAIFTAFIEQHRGFLLKELISHSMSEERLLGMLRTGAQLLDPQGKFVDDLEEPPRAIVEKPHYVGLTREVALSRVGHWVASLFVPATPRFAFRPSEQRLLLAALGSGTDEELAAELRVSLSAVKKTWVLIYERVSAYLPDFSSDRKPNGMTERGKEKKHRLLTYLREHPEELRPASL